MDRERIDARHHHQQQQGGEVAAPQVEVKQAADASDPGGGGGPAATTPLHDDLEKALAAKDSAAIFKRLDGTSTAERAQLLADDALLADLQKGLSPDGWERALDLLDAPLPAKVKAGAADPDASRGPRFVMASISSASAAARRAALQSSDVLDGLAKLDHATRERALSLLGGSLPQLITAAIGASDPEFLMNAVESATPDERTALAADGKTMARLKNLLSEQLYLRLVAELSGRGALAAGSLEERINRALASGNLEPAYLFQQIRLATDAERAAVLADKTFVDGLKAKISGADFGKVLQGLGATLRDRVDLALTLADTRALFDAVASASDSDRAALAADSAFIDRAKGSMRPADLRRLIDDLGASLVAKLQIATDLRDEAMVRRAFASATAAERAALKDENSADPAGKAVIASLKKMFTGDADYQALFAVSAVSEASSVEVNQIDPVAAFNLLVRGAEGPAPKGPAVMAADNTAPITARLDAYDASQNPITQKRNSALGLIQSLPRGQDCPNDVRASLSIVILNDSNFDRVQAAFKARWDVDLQTIDGKDDKGNVVAGKWDPVTLRGLHSTLIKLPDAHVDAKVLRTIAIEAATNGGWWNGATYAVGQDAVAVPDQVYGDPSAAPGSVQAPHATSWLSAVTRHEIGHSVDDLLGSRTLSLKQGMAKWTWGGDIDQWSEGMDAFRVVTPPAGKPRLVPPEDQQAIKDAITAFLKTDNTSTLDATVPDGHAVKTWYNAGLPILETVKRIQGKGAFWVFAGVNNDLYQSNGRVYSLNFGYQQFQACGVQVQQHPVRDYMLHSHAEFFAELYTVYYEDGADDASHPGQRMPVDDWRTWFDRNVHAAGFSPQSVAATGAPNSGKSGAAPKEGAPPKGKAAAQAK